MNDPIIYKVHRSEERRTFVMGYKGSSEMDTSYFYAPYIPGQPLQELPKYSPPTDFQNKLMASIKQTPMIRFKFRNDRT